MHKATSTDAGMLLPGTLIGASGDMISDTGRTQVVHQRGKKMVKSMNAGNVADIGKLIHMFMEKKSIDTDVDMPMLKRFRGYQLITSMHKDDGSCCIPGIGPKIDNRIIVNDK